MLDKEGKYVPPTCGCWSTDCHYIGILCEGPQREPEQRPTAAEMEAEAQEPSVLPFDLTESELMLVLGALEDSSSHYAKVGVNSYSRALSKLRDDLKAQLDAFYADNHPGYE